MLLKRGSFLLFCLIPLTNSSDIFYCIVVRCGLGEVVNVNQTCMPFFPRSMHLINDSHLNLYQIHHWTHGANRVKEINFLGIFF